MIDKLTKDFIRKIVLEMNKEDNKNNIQENILNPILTQFTNRIYPYVTLLFIMYSLNLIIILVILILIIIMKNKELHKK